MNDQPASGNRWEPRLGVPIPHDADSAPASPASAQFEGGVERPRPVRPRRASVRTKAVGAAAALFLLSGAGGFAVGHLVSPVGDITPTTPGQRGTSDDQGAGSDHGDTNGSGDDGAGEDGDSGSRT